MTAYCQNIAMTFIYVTPCVRYRTSFTAACLTGLELHVMTDSMTLGCQPLSKLVITLGGAAEQIQTRASLHTITADAVLRPYFPRLESSLYRH